MVRHLALFDETPYKSCLINGMVLGADGRKMSKSLKNYVAAPEVLNKNGADATRQWAAGGGATGSDIPFRAPDVEYGRRFLVKLWNVAGFTSKLLADYEPEKAGNVALQPLDKWILSKAENLTQKVTDAFEKCQFNIAVEEIRNFTWHVFCDAYVEAVKDRLYRPEVQGEEARVAAQQTLYNVLYRILQLLAPVTPHLTEEIYQTLYADRKGYKSLQVSPWPEFNPAGINVEQETQGDLCVAVINDVRRRKAEEHKPLNMPLQTLTVYAGTQANTDVIAASKGDIAGTLKVDLANFKILAEAGEGKEVERFPGVTFVFEYGEPVKK